MIFLLVSAIQEETQADANFGCDLCEILVQGVEEYVQDPTNVQAVEEFLDQVCELISPIDFFQWCEQLIDKYYQELLQNIIAGYGPQQCCEAIGLC
ncbi:Saposin-like_type B domin-containing protein [Hexamita inflata]|uniref:Saposin-like type B domin-containing protein n=1 Tax=Hexamita inflata TaxID=28002 RepID=A0AA86VBY6_9EUKA|nr:Saposin-like type B domin-containing protein [Hexamita inflata]